jgi:hypothetical protein
MKIEKTATRFHSKASERYVDVIFYYPSQTIFRTSVPIEYRRTGTLIDDTLLDDYLEKVYVDVNPENWRLWHEEQSLFWRTKPGANTTKEFFDVLAKSFDWCCVNCDLPKNRNWARRIQDIKEFGFTLSTNTKRRCAKCLQNTTHLLLLPLRRGGITGYETWSADLRNRIIGVLQTFDCYEAKSGKKEGLLPDHKFPEIRWDGDTKRQTLESLSDDAIRRDFQLLSNQRNQQKREVCRKCFQTGQRGEIYGIPFFYQGQSQWDPHIPLRGKEAEKGCIGCGWYDIKEWRAQLIRKLKS